jgi:hypothetical protein
MLLIICVVQYLFSNSDVGAELASAAEEVVRHDLADDDCLCLLLDPGEMCNCRFSDPVVSLTTKPNSLGDPLVLLPKCSVKLARLPSSSSLPSRSYRLSRNKVPVLDQFGLSSLIFSILQVPVIYGSKSESDNEVGLFLPFGFRLELFNVQAFDIDSGSGESDMTQLSRIESESDMNKVPTMAIDWVFTHKYLGGVPVSLGQGWPGRDWCCGCVHLHAPR